MGFSDDANSTVGRAIRGSSASAQNDFAIVPHGKVVFNSSDLIRLRMPHPTTKPFRVLKGIAVSNLDVFLLESDVDRWKL